MNKRVRKTRFLLLTVAFATICAGGAPAVAGPLKVFILAGQSNMQGHANIATLDSMAEDPKTAPLLKEMREADGTPYVCRNVWISSIGCGGNQYSDMIEKTGMLAAGFGASTDEIGPEFTFGITMEKRLGEPILIIKTSWGGRSLHTDFRPPSAGVETINDFILSQWRKRGLDAKEETAKIHKNDGVFYHAMIAHVKKVLADIKRVMPGYNPKQGYELAGFVWFQGFNDMVDDWTYHNRMQHDGYAEYGRLLTLFIRDVRRDLSAPKMPFVIGVMGIGGEKEGQRPPQSNFRLAQAAPTLLPEFRRNVVAVQTAAYWDDALETLRTRLESLWPKMDARAAEALKSNPKMSGEEVEAVKRHVVAENFSPEEQKRLKAASNGGYHYLGAAKILAPIGQTFADAILALHPRWKRKP